MINRHKRGTMIERACKAADDSPNIKIIGYGSSITFQCGRNLLSIGEDNVCHYFAMETPDFTSEGLDIVFPRVINQEMAIKLIKKWKNNR